MTPERPMIRLFGALSVESGDHVLGPRDLGGARPKQVLEILLAARGHPVSFDRLADLLWGRDPPDNVAGSLHTFVSVLRRHLTSATGRGRELVVTEREAYRFATELAVVDLDCFDALLIQALGAPTRTARASLERALRLARGDVLEDEPYGTWAVELRATYQDRVLVAHLQAAEAALAELDHRGALAHSEAAAAIDRLSDPAHRLEILALYAVGRPHEAVRRYQRFRIRLDEELGLRPSPETRAIEAAILREDDVQSLLPRPTPGARPSAGGAAVRLLGRAAELETLERAVRRALDGPLRLILVEGERGLGKTRVLEELGGTLVDVRVGRAAASELERHLPYVPLATALRDALGDVEIDAGRLPALAGMLPELRLEGPRQRFDEVETLEALVALAADHAPLVLMIDDLHWADPQTIAALGYLRRRGTGLGAALVVTVQPHAGGNDDTLLRLEPDEVVRLEPLTSEELEPLGVPDLHESTGGNPRFVTEALRSGDGGGPSQELTDSLLAQCRIAGAIGCRVLIAASMLDQPFEPEPLAVMLGADPAELTEELERLCDRRVLCIDGLRFRFRYEIVRRALLGSISPARQRLLRERIGRMSATGMTSRSAA
jgi:DNA-binding SARP family transcriptional activator